MQTHFCGSRVIFEVDSQQFISWLNKFDMDLIHWTLTHVGWFCIKLYEQNEKKIKLNERNLLDRKRIFFQLIVKKSRNKLFKLICGSDLSLFLFIF